MTRSEKPPAAAGPAELSGPASLDELRDAALRHHRQGEPQQAAALFRRALAIAPDDPGALNGLGCLLYQGGDAAGAATLLQRAAAAAPCAADVQANYGHSLTSLGRLQEAASAYEASLAAAPRQAELWHALATIRDHLFAADEAIAAARALVAEAPTQAAAHLQLGRLYHKESRFAEAIASFTEARGLAPEDGAVAQQLAQALSDDGQYEAADSLLRGALDAAAGDAPSEAALAFQLGRLLALQDRLDAALALADRLAEAAQGLDEPRLLAADQIYRLALRNDKALAPLERLVGGPAPSPASLLAMASLLQAMGRIGESIRIAKRVLSAEPGNGGALLTLSLAYLDCADVGQALDAYRAAAEALPTQASLRSARLTCLNYDATTTAAAQYQAARDWDARFGRPLAAARRAHDNDADPERRLRVGYVSPDFRRHSVAYFAEPLFEAHDRAAVEVTGYAELARPDATSRRFEALADRWRNTADQGDRQVAARIRADRIDILVDLAGHTASNRLCTFALKPAPLAVTWLGYPGTTGLEAIDYRLTDEICDPPGEAERWHSESLIRLPGGFLCYRPDDSAPPVAPPPSPEQGHVTFGSFNHPAKIGEPLVAAWSEILRRLPSAKLSLKGRGLDDPFVRERFHGRFAAAGIGPERLILRGPTAATEAHLAAYGEIDVALDCFPYNGTTTTFEALWMGVPVVTLAGDRHAGRVGMSLLQRLDLGAMVAESPDAYVETALALAADQAGLAGLRSGLRDRLRASPLMDGEAFARKVEGVYREIWRRWCESRRAAKNG